MAKIELWSVGKKNDPLVNKAIEEYTQRLNRYYACKWLILQPAENVQTIVLQKKEEAQSISKQLQATDFLVLLDETGQQLNSIKLANFIEQQMNSSYKRIIFLIGGAYGVDETIKTRADLIWSLSQLVFPHMLARLILAEQLYRACTIIKNEKYHHV
jgi:23S rRNA (pseudouridine1915-N3)-methyltransferase